MRFARIKRRRRMPPRGTPAQWLLLIAFLLAISPRPASAIEQAEEFVKGLQDRGLHALALEYLDELKTSPLANDTVRGQVPYLRGEALIQQSRQSSDVAVRNRLLEEARKELTDFADANPRNVSGAEAQLQLATVQMTRAQELVADAARLPADKSYDSQRKELNRNARMRFAEARETFQRSESIYNKELEKLPPAAANETHEDAGTQRQQYRGRVAQLRYLASQIQFEVAQTYPLEAEEYKKIMKSAAEELAAVYEEFARSNLFIALNAHLTEGRCYHAMGENQMALGCYEDILKQPYPSAPFRKLFAQTTRHKAEALMAQDKYDPAIDACNAILRDTHKDEEKQSDWLAVRYRLAEALAKKADRTPANTTDHKRLVSAARDEFAFVAKTPSEFQLVARTAVAMKSSNGVAEADGTKKEPRNFQAAYDAGKEALSSYNAAKQAIPTAERNNPSAVPELKEQMEQGKEDARRYFRLASSLVEPDTDLKLVNEVRYFLGWLYWEGEDYYRAAILGEYLARRFPDHPAAGSAAKISMASYERLYNRAVAANNPKDKGELEAGKMAEMADFIVRRWPGTDDADAAFGILVGSAIRNGKTEDAERMIQQASAPSRPRLELLLGNALWAKYLDMSQPGAAKPAHADAIAKLEASALKHMHAGFDAARKETPISDAAVMAALYLVQSQLGDGNFAEAIALLEDKDIGPLKLISSGNALAARPQYSTLAYTNALQAYVSISPPQEKKALDTMQSLDKLIKDSGDAKATEKLERIYVGLAAALQKQVDDLRAAGKAAESAKVAASLAKVLERVPANPQSGWQTRAQLGLMYYSLGTGISSNNAAGPRPNLPVPKDLSKQAREQLTKARDLYQQLVEEATRNPKFAPNENALLAAKVQLAECFRALGQYDKSLDTFYDVLNARESTLSVQRAAAAAYQERGQNDDQKFLDSAIYGGYKAKDSGKNRVWGWLRISEATARSMANNPLYRDAFYEARFNIAKCHYLAALKLKGNDRTARLKRARQSYQTFAQLYPDLGGETWKPQFEQLQSDLKQTEDNPEPAASP